MLCSGAKPENVDQYQNYQSVNAIDNFGNGLKRVSSKSAVENGASATLRSRRMFTHMVLRSIVTMWLNIFWWLIQSTPKKMKVMMYAEKSGIRLQTSACRVAHPKECPNKLQNQKVFSVV